MNSSPEITSPRNKRFPGWLRWLAWVGFVVLFLATCAVVVRWVVLGRGHTKVQKIVNRQRTQPPPAQPTTPSDAAAQPAAELRSARESPKATPLGELPLIGMAFSDDPAVRAEFGRLLSEVRRFSQAFREARDKDGVISFRKVLANLGIAVPDAMTEAEAAAEFLRQTEKISGTLAQLRDSLETGGWDWGNFRGWTDPEYFDRRSQVFQMLSASAYATSGIIQAHWRTGDGDAAWRDWEMLHLSAVRPGEAGHVFGSVVEGSLHSIWARTVGAGISLGVWTDDQLARFPQLLASYDAIASMHHGLQAEKEHVYNLGRRPGEVRTLMKTMQGGGPPATGFGAMVRRLAIDLTTDQQIQDNLAVYGANYDYAMGRFDLEKRAYVPPMPGEKEPSLEIWAERSFFTDFYFMPLRSLAPAGDPEKGSVLSSMVSRAVEFQTGTDQARLAAALEMQHRATGQYPDSLDAVGSLYPAGMPHDVATGQPYRYERSSDGAYKLWGTGIDQTNDSGDPEKDILFTSPTIQPR